MEIEKVTFYRPNPQFSKNGELGNSSTLNRISLPRVKFLEVDGPYKPQWAIEYIPPESTPLIVLRREPKAQLHGSKKKLTPITKFEQLIGELSDQGLTYDQIVEKTGKTKSVIVAGVNRYKAKILIAQNAA